MIVDSYGRSTIMKISTSRIGYKVVMSHQIIRGVYHVMSHQIRVGYIT